MATSQREIFNQFKAVQSSTSLAPYVSPVSASLDNLDITGFLFELIKQTKGQEGLKSVVMKSALGEINNSAEISNTVFMILKEVFFCFFDLIIPQDATVGQDGYTINVSEIDPTKMLNTDPNSPEGRHLYEGNDPAKHLNYLIYTAFSSDKPVPYYKNGKLLFTLYYNGSNEFKFHFGADYAGVKLSVWAEDYLQDVSLFNLPNFMAELVDIITGAVSIKTKKSTEDIQQNATIQVVLRKLFGFCKQNPDNNGSGANNTVNPNEAPPEGQVLDTSPITYLQNQEDKNKNGNDGGNLFNFTSSELLQIEDIADLLSRGKVRFSTCGNLELAINPDDIFAKLDALFADAMLDATTPNPDDPAQQVQSYDNNAVYPNIDNLASFINGVLRDNVTNEMLAQSDGNEQGSPSGNDIAVNLPNIEVEFELSVIKAIPFALTQMIISPQLMLLIKAAALVIGEEENNGVFTLETVFNKIWKFVQKIGESIWNSLLNNIFNILIKELTGILSGLATKYLTQKFNNYTTIISFIMNLINGLNLSANGCQSMLDIIMRLLSMNYFGPALPVAPPLVYAGGMLKPGLNSVSINNSVKAAFADLGVETGKTTSDGSPNVTMAMFERYTEVLTKKMMEDASVQIMVNGITGPAMGYGQIS